MTPPPDRPSATSIAYDALRKSDEALRLSGENKGALRDMELTAVTWRTAADARHTILESKFDALQVDVSQVKATVQDYTAFGKLINASWKIAGWLLVIAGVTALNIFGV